MMKRPESVHVPRHVAARTRGQPCNPRRQPGRDDDLLRLPLCLLVRVRKARAIVVDGFRNVPGASARDACGADMKQLPQTWTAFSQAANRRCRLDVRAPEQLRVG